MDDKQIDELEQVATAAVRHVTPENILLLIQRYRQLERENWHLAAMLANWAAGRKPELLEQFEDELDVPEASTFRAAARRAVEETIKS